MKIEKEVCDNCEENEDDNLFTCQLCKQSDEILCEDCMTSHLEDKHSEEIVEKFIEESFDDVTKKA